MTNQPARTRRPALDVRGAVDLGALAARRPAAAAQAASNGAGEPAAQGSAPVLNVTDATFVAEVVHRSSTVPVVLDFWATWCQPCTQLSPVLERLAAEFGGRFLLAKVDVDANPQLSQAFQVQSIPSVYAVLKGQPIPLFQGAQPEAQVRQVLTELLRVAEANGVTGMVDVVTGEEGDEGAGEEEDLEQPLPPLHQEAYDAIDRGDFAAAVAAYEKALRENPADELATVGLAQVRLLERTQDADPVAARARAAAAPDDIDAQLLAADLDVLGSQVGDAFSRLVDLVRRTAGADRDRVRQHLIGLFQVVGPDDPSVPPARLALANALF